MSQAQTRRVETLDGQEVRVRPVRRVDDETVRVDLRDDSDRRWRLDVERDGHDAELITSWDENGDLADVPLPDWLDEVLSRL